jgi:G3E family GTPase
MKKIITLHYIMRNGRGENLEESSTSFLYGSTALSPLLQSQLKDLQPGDTRIITLPKGAEGADDDFSFEVTLIAIRNATPAELQADRFLSPVKIHLLSGFLGAGKTTAIEQASQYLQKQNIPIAVITNDQGDRLVDGSRFLHLGIPSREVSGGCLCCNYNTLEENIGALTTATRPTMVFAEAVGSCTDLIATVLKPLLRQHPEWQPTISVFADAQLLTASVHDPTIRYIYQKQLEEAQVLVVTRSEGFPEQWKKDIQVRFPGKIILFHNSYREADIQRWLDILELLPRRPALPSLDIDYDIYAEGEARLAWLDQDLTIDSQQAAEFLMTALHSKLEKENYPVRRLKFWRTPTTLLINARVQTDRLTLMQIVADTIAEMTTLYPCDIRTVTYNCFQPAYPKPQHRIA